MVLGTLIRWGLPLSYVYCTIWQQDIWREGDENLIIEQKHTWKKFFGLIDCGYCSIARGLNLDSQASRRLNLVAKIESMDLTQRWNRKVMEVFEALSHAKSESIDLSSLTKSLGLTK